MRRTNPKDYDNREAVTTAKVNQSSIAIGALGKLNPTPPKLVQWFDLTAAEIAAGFDATGLGLEDTDYYHWAICNGNNGTRDIQGKFVRANTTEAGGTGGQDTLDHKHNVAVGVSGYESAHTHSTPSGTSGSTTLTTAQIPAHSHALSNPSTSHLRYVADASGSYTMGAGTAWKDNYSTASDGGTGGSHNHTTPAGTSGAGSSHTHTTPASETSGASHTDNRPEYIELVPAMRIS
jgi:hypothetical protein